jgi:hypothetical protein
MLSPARGHRPPPRGRPQGDEDRGKPSPYYRRIGLLRQLIGDHVILGEMKDNL